MREVPEDILWQSMTGELSEFVVGRGGARRLVPGNSPIAAFRDTTDPDFEALAEFCVPLEPLYTSRWGGEPPAGWTIETESTMFRMVWEGGMPEEPDTTGMVTLGLEHREAALELAELTHPGPFGIDTVKLGQYYGYFDGSKLIAMGGERFKQGAFHEISGVCTHPDYQGRGLAKKIITRLLRNHAEKGKTSFLHVMSGNEVARPLYARMGFRELIEVPVRVFWKDA